MATMRELDDRFSFQDRNIEDYLSVRQMEFEHEIKKQNLTWEHKVDWEDFAQKRKIENWEKIYYPLMRMIIKATITLAVVFQSIEKALPLLQSWLGG